MFSLIHNLMIIPSIYQIFDMEFSISFYLFLLIQWYINKNECILSYYHKKNKDSNYLLGDRYDDVSDLFVSKLSFFNKFKLDKILYILLIPHFYFYITKKKINSILLSLIIITCYTLENIMSSRKRYIFLVILIYLATDNVLISNKYINVSFKIFTFLNIFTSSVIFYKFKNEKNIFEIILINVLTYTYILSKYF